MGAEGFQGTIVKVEKFGVLGGVRVVAGGTAEDPAGMEGIRVPPNRMPFAVERRDHMRFRNLVLMTVGAQVGDIHRQKIFVPVRMRVMAGGACPHGRRAVHVGLLLPLFYRIMARHA